MTSSTKPEVHTVSQRELTQGHRQHAQNVCVKLRVSFLRDASRQTDKQTCSSQYSAVLRREQHKTFKTSRIYLAMLRVVKKLHISDNWPSKKLSTNGENVCDLAFVPDADIWPASGVILLQVSHSSVVTQVTQNGVRMNTQIPCWWKNFENQSKHATVRMCYFYGDPVCWRTFAVELRAFVGDVEYLAVDCDVQPAWRTTAVELLQFRNAQLAVFLWHRVQRFTGSCCWLYCCCLNSTRNVDDTFYTTVASHVKT